MKLTVAFAVTFIFFLAPSSSVFAQTSPASPIPHQSTNVPQMSMPAATKEDPAREPHYKYNHWNATTKVNPDGTSETLIDQEVTVLKDDVLENVKTDTVDFSTSAEKVEIVEAYTHKANGKRIDVPKDNFQTHVDDGKDGAPPAFSDHSSITIIFPDLAVGDSTVLVYKHFITKPLYANNYSIILSFSKFGIWDHVKVHYDLPKSMNVQIENNQMIETLNKEDNDRVIREWTFQNKEIDKTKFPHSAVYDYSRLPHVALSTFPSYQAISAAYGQGAQAKAQATDQIRKLAEEITKGKTDKREQAKSIYDWVSKNITYAGNCIAIGAVVPRDLDFVLENKMGDCKDHATLVQALLAAKNIASTQALLNAEAIYTLPKLPIASVVNHVINYIPSLDIFVDATATDIPFGVLPHPDAGKIVLLVDGYKDGMKTPLMPKGFMDSKLDMVLKIAEDGSAEGQTDVTYHGYEAIAANKGFEKLEKIDEHKWLEMMIKKSNLEGTAELANGTYNEAAETYSYSIKYKLANFIKIGQPGAVYIYPLLSMSNIARSLYESRTEETDVDFMCSGGSNEENFTIDFPNNVKVLAIPDPFEAASSLQTYKSTYKLDGSKFTAVRTLHDVTPGPTCTKGDEQIYKDLADKAWSDIKVQIVYK